ncbi:polymer-forming cytoskeletal protein [Bacillaceae bacterium Marseille-Q3522]|nr:polymer-forming cytoskeletal protein [Bacillaceae bacterium Marseille-Q3522]
MKATLKFLFISIFAVALLAACGNENTSNDESTEPTDESADVVTSASIVDEAEALVNGLSEDGTWIVATLNDITVEDEIVVAGEFHDKDDPSADIYRKLGLYTQDEDHNITDSFTLTAPKMTVQSENFRIQGGTFVGDVYVEANGFNLHETAKIDGNIYYASDEYQESAVIDGDVTGTEEVQ